MTAFLSWVDYSSAERQRMRQAVALFSERDTRDELGLGSIRDAISNALFPGISVIQTRLRYALFIPWIYRELETNKRIHAANVESVARANEIALIESLVQSDDTVGVIGRRARHTLQRLPSSVYWIALGRWGILQRDWSTEEYHRNWERLREAKRGDRRADDAGVMGESIASWHPHLPAPPEGFPEVASFRLEPAEAEFVQERIRESCRGTLLAYAVDAEDVGRPHLDTDFPWDAFQGRVPGQLKDELTLARKFSVLMQGAALCYNLALARSADAFREKAEAHAEALAEWYEGAQAEGVASWSLEELWSFCGGRANVTQPTQVFVSSWQQLLRAEGLGVAESPEAARLVEQREWRLKGPRSRFRNPRALEIWGGDSGTAAMNYRWHRVRELLKDLYAGLDGKGS